MCDSVSRMRWLCFLAAAAAFVFAQLPAPNAAGVTPGHLHFVVPDADVMTKAWIDQFGAVQVTSNSLKPLKLPGIYVIVSGARGGRGGDQPAAKPAGTRGSVVDHIGFEVRDWDAFKSKAQAANMPWQEVTAGTQAFLTMPDDVTVEIMGNKDLKVPVQFHHIHMAVKDAQTAKDAQAWYMKEFGAGAGSRRNLPSAMFTVGEVDFLPARGGRNGEPPAVPAGTKGRALDHSAGALQRSGDARRPACRFGEGRRAGRRSPGRDHGGQRHSGAHPALSPPAPHPRGEVTIEVDDSLPGVRIVGTPAAPLPPASRWRRSPQ